MLHAQGTLETQIGRGLQHKRGGKILCRKTGIEMAEHDFVDILGRNTGIAERRIGYPHDKALDGLAFEPAERGMRPAHDGGSHAIHSFAEIRSLSFGIYQTQNRIYYSGKCGHGSLCVYARLWSR